MMKKLSTTALASILALSSLGFVASSYAMPSGEGYEKCMHGKHGKGHGEKHGRRGFDIDRMAEKLNLSDEQRASMQAIVDESKPEITALREKMRDNRKQLKELAQTSPFNEAEARKLADAQGDLKADMIVLRMQQRSKMHDILTEEQRMQMKEMREKRHSRQ